jgi:hypothetical protein
MLSYDELAENESRFLAMTSLTVEEFQRIHYLCSFNFWPDFYSKQDYGYPVST